MSDKRPFIAADNFELRVLSNAEAHYKEGLRICFDAHRKATSFKADEHGLTLYWSESAGEALPYPMDYDTAVEFVAGWMRTDEASELRGPKPDLDGSCTRGFLLTNTSKRGGGGWSGDRFYEIATIKPVWVEHHK